jgi:hypothetical protein
MSGMTPATLPMAGNAHVSHAMPVSSLNILSLLSSEVLKGASYALESLIIAYT